MYIDDKGTLGKLSKEIRGIIIENAESISSRSFDLRRILPEKMALYYKNTILKWFTGKE